MTTQGPVGPSGGGFSRLWLRLVPAYAAGYFLSYGLRTVNAVIAPELMRDLALGASALGLLTSAYLLAFGLFQIPLGVMLDRWGPRRVEASLLLVAALGCAVFASGQELETLVMGRALIGLGVSACLMASFKAFSQWFPAERLPALSATIMVAGGLGALSASVPVAAALPFLGWRGVFGVVSLLLVGAAVVLICVPDQAGAGARESLMLQLRSLRGIYSHRVFWRFAPQGALVMGGFMAMQGLWAVPWLMEVNGMARADAATVLLAMALAQLGGFLLVAVGSAWLARQGLSPMRLLTLGMGMALVVELAILRQWLEPILLWAALGLSFSLGNIAYSQLSAAFPTTLAGRVNTALNLAVFVGAFGLQWGIGAVVDQLVGSGVGRTAAFEVALSALLCAQAAAYAWFLAPVRGAAGVQR